jgi:hypothetical protein
MASMLEVFTLILHQALRFEQTAPRPSYLFVFSH